MKYIFISFLIIVFSINFLEAKQTVSNFNFTASKNQLQISEPDSVVYKFYLINNTTTTIKFVNIYGGNEILYEKDNLRKSGWQNFVLYSKDLNKENTSSGIYYLDISGKDMDNNIVEFNSFMEPWGERVTARDVRRNVNTGEISYSLSKVCLAKVRLGFSNGSLLRTLFNWTPHVKGKHQTKWDGYDQSKKLKVDKKFDPDVRVFAFKIPKTSFYLNNAINPIDYKKKMIYPNNWEKYALHPHAKINWQTNIDVAVDFEISVNADTTFTIHFLEQNSEFNKIYSNQNEIYVSIGDNFVIENPDVEIPGDFKTYYTNIPTGNQIVIINIILANNRIAAGLKEVLF